VHLQRHHAAYINNLNAALANFTQLQSKTLTELVAMVGTGLLPAEIETRVSWSAFVERGSRCL
jgi:Fe-Mn family superoxide dismutase